MVARFISALRPAQVAQTRTAPLDSTVLPPPHLKCHEGHPAGHDRPDYGIKRHGAIPAGWYLSILEMHSRSSHVLPLNAGYGSAGWQHLSLRRPMPWSRANANTTRATDATIQMPAVVSTPMNATIALPSTQTPSETIA